MLFKGSGGKFNKVLRKLAKLWTSHLARKQTWVSPLGTASSFFWFLSACFLLWQVWSNHDGGLELSPRTLSPKVLGSLPYLLFFPLQQESNQHKPTESYLPPLPQKSLRPKLKPVFPVTVLKDAKSKQEQLFRWSPSCSCSLFLSHHYLIHVTIYFQYDLIFLLVKV